MTEHPHLPPMPVEASKPPWTSAPFVLGMFAVALGFALVVLAGIQWATDWPRWSAAGVLAVLCAIAWAGGRVTRSDRWAVFWDCSLFAWLSGVLILGGHLLLPLSDGFVEDVVVTWGSVAVLLVWRRWQVRRGLRGSMEAPIRHPRREETRVWLTVPSR
jgi:hypothetical protein